MVQFRYDCFCNFDFGIYDPVLSCSVSQWRNYAEVCVCGGGGGGGGGPRALMQRTKVHK